MSNSTIEQIEAALNQRQHWLNIEPARQPDGAVQLVVNINGHFATEAASDASEAVATAIVGLFDSLAVEVERATGDVLGPCTASHPAAGTDCEVTVGQQ